MLYSKGFNFDQTEGTYQPPVFKAGKQYSVDAIDQFVKSTKVDLRHKEEGRCFYSPTGDYINKERVGLWEIYSIGGISKGSMNYSAGKLDGLSVTKYKNGMAADSSEHKADKRHGTRKEFFSDGKIKKESNYLEGNLNGRLAIYFANGKIKVSGRYDSAKRDGLWVIYDEKQRILKYQLYRNGKEVSENENMKLIEGRGIKIYTPLVEEEEDGRYDKIEKNLLNNVPY